MYCSSLEVLQNRGTKTKFINPWLLCDLMTAMLEGLQFVYVYIIQHVCLVI